jgi:hypothetical protein
MIRTQGPYMRVLRFGTCRKEMAQELRELSEANLLDACPVDIRECRTLYAITSQDENVPGIIEKAKQKVENTLRCRREQVQESRAEYERHLRNVQRQEINKIQKTLPTQNVRNAITRATGVVLDDVQEEVGQDEEDLQGAIETKTNDVQEEVGQDEEDLQGAIETKTNEHTTERLQQKETIPFVSPAAECTSQKYALVCVLPDPNPEDVQCPEPCVSFYGGYETADAARNACEDEIKNNGASYERFCTIQMYKWVALHKRPI